jgi:tRNA (adenine37-N6)-methyltransferase
MRLGVSTVVAVLIVMCFPGFGGQTKPPRESSMRERTFVLRPIGQVEKTDGSTRIVLDRRYQPGLLGLEGFSHAYVFWWFDQNDAPEKRAVLQVHPRGVPQNPLTGVFATRSPVRPNLIGLTLCKIVSIRENVVEVEKIDAFPGTPILDIKPFIPGSDTAVDAKAPDWLK